MMDAGKTRTVHEVEAPGLASTLMMSSLCRDGDHAASRLDNPCFQCECLCHNLEPVLQELLRVFEESHKAIGRLQLTRQRDIVRAKMRRATSL
jgi:hypothetical protein